MKTIAIILLLAFATFASCERIVHNFKSAENGVVETQKCKVGDTIELNFDENPTTGYEWIIPEEKEGWNYIWSLKESTYTSNSNPSGMVGVGGKRKFVLDINLPGEEIATFVYGRPWLYDNAMSAYRTTGNFDASIMEGQAVQLDIQSSA